MITSLVAGVVVAGAGIGWYGHKASVRIARWGEAMNEQDRLIRSLSGDEDGWKFENGRADQDVRFGASFGSHHLPAATSK